ncbi:MAG: hypothetical protein HYS86_04035, partial [Candidatus Chisholmbacteria bacterium]|nr:hypothetical protein [Candidatus Chisholmbacteria bacterium]
MSEPLAILELRTPKDSQESPEAAAQFFSSLPKLKASFWDRLLGTETPLSFEIASINQTIYFLTTFPESERSYLESQLTASYPKLVITPLKEYIPPIAKLTHPKAGLLHLTAPNYFPLKTYIDFRDVDPLSTVLGTLAKVEAQDFLLIQFLVSPAPTS